MSDATPTVIYLEPDDEITAVVRRLRETDAPRIILVAPGRTKATTSAMGLRLLGSLAREEGRELILVADAAARSLATEAGIASAPSLAEARELRDVTVASAPHMAGSRITVARGSRAVPVPAPTVGPERDPSFDETRSVPVAPPAGRPAPPVRRRSSASRSVPVALLVAVALLLVGALAAGAFLLPGATIRVAPRTAAIGPFAYELLTGDELALQQESGDAPVSASGTATGIHEVRVQASGVVVLQNWNTVAVEVPAGTQVAAGEIVFATGATVVVPPGGLTSDGTIAPGTESVGVTAVEAGPAGNVAAEAIDTMLSQPTASRLRGFPNSQLRVVINPDPTVDGAAEDVPIIEQADVDAVLDGFRGELASAVTTARTDDPNRIYLDAAEGDQGVDVTVPDDLVGREGEAAFDLAGTIHWTVRWLARDEVEAAAAARLVGDAAAATEGRELVEEAVAVIVDQAALTGDSARIAVHVTAATRPIIDLDALRTALAGVTREEAIALLAPIGPASVDLWPGWVDRITGIGWRVEIIVESEIDIQPSAGPTAAAAP
ncbi:MAG: hypothetical protein ABI622_04150 [Chloroflexota bacterium]